MKISLVPITGSVLYAAALAMAVATPASAQDPPPVIVQPGAPGQPTRTLTPEEAEVIRGHYEELAALQEEGKLEFAGRSQDAQFGLAIFRMDSEAEVRAAFEHNPAIVAGLLSIEVRPYNLALDRDPT